MAPIVTLVHGTFARGAAWTKDGSSLRGRLSARLGEIEFTCFSWSGWNAPWARDRAAARLRAHLRAVAAAHPNRPHFLIAHSHAGNIALYALRDPAVQAQVRGVTCLSTPFINAQPRPLGPAAFSGLKGMIAAPFAIMIQLLSLLFVAGLERPEESELRFIAFLVVFMLGPFVALGIGGALLRSWIARAKRRAQRFHPPRLTVPLLIVRTSGDEASALLALAQISTWILNRFFGAICGVAGLLWRLAQRIHAAVEKAFSTDTAGFLVVIAVELGLVWNVPLLIAGMAGAILICVSELCLVVSGFGIGLSSLLVEVTAEPTPPGTWTVHHIPGTTQWPVQQGFRDAPAPRLNHSAAYENPLVHELIADWIRQDGRLAEPGALIRLPVEVYAPPPSEAPRVVR